MKTCHVVLHLSLIDGVGPVTIAKIGDWIAKQSGDWAVLYTMSAQQLSYACRLTPSVAQLVVAGLANQQLLSAELTLIAKHQIRWVTVFDQEYPPFLRAIHTPPAVLYWRGIDLVNLSCVAVIGSRKANQYASRVINKLVPALVARDITIVSGGAIGADTMAHQAALAAGGVTLVVLGSGLLKPYPRKNEALFDAIADGRGAILSSFSLMTSPLPGNFPARNRIIAGLSMACVVVQATAQSGATITAQYALDEGREVCAVPGAIDDELSVGCHALIAQGATLLQSVDDIAAVSAYQCRDISLVPHKVPKISGNTPVNNYPQRVDQDQKPSDRLVGFCQSPQSLDELVARTGYTVSHLQDQLFELQLEGRLIQDFTGMWVAC
jgi:DNA processing protein